MWWLVLAACSTTSASPKMNFETGGVAQEVAEQLGRAVQLEAVDARLGVGTLNGALHHAFRETRSHHARAPSGEVVDGLLDRSESSNTPMDSTRRLLDYSRRCSHARE